MDNYSFYNVFYALAKLSKDFNEKGIVNTSLEKICDETTNEYLESILNLVKDALPIDIINFNLDYKLQEIMLDYDLSKFNIKELYIIKHMFPYIYNCDIDSLDNFIFFSREILEYDDFSKLCEYASKIKLLNNIRSGVELKLYGEEDKNTCS